MQSLQIEDYGFRKLMERISLKNGFEAYRNLMALISGGSPSYATETKSFTRLAARDLGFQL